MTTGLWSVGSVTDYIGTIVGWTNIPTSISGNTFSNMVEQEINYCEQFKTVTINSSAIAEKYQPVVCDLVHSKLLLAIEEQQGGVDSVSLGDLKVSQGNSSNAQLAKQLRTDAIMRLKELQRTVRFKKVIGGI